MSDTLSFHECLAVLLGREIPSDVEPAHDPEDGTLRARYDISGNVEVHYVSRDPFPPARFWPTDGSRGRLVPLRGKNRNEVESRYGLALPVRVTPDGARIAMPTAGTLSSTHLYVPPEKASERGLSEAVEWSTLQLASYDAWRRGEIYGLVRETFTFVGGDLIPLDVKADWIHVDLSQARDALDARATQEPSGAPSP